MTQQRLNSVQEFYKDKTIFITGASGFMGKVLVEKLLYSCSDVKQIIILMRTKKGKSEQARVKEFEALPLFKRIMEEKPEVMRKLHVVSGEISEPNLGLSAAHMQYVIDNTNIIFHVAASVRFTAPLRQNIMTNLVATKEAIDLAKRVKNLLIMVHVSTAFCNVEFDENDEKIHDAPGKPLNLIELAQQMDESAMSSLEDQLLPPHPNTYTYTKRLAEILVRDEFERSKLPVCIVRPSIVGPAFKEPIPGWVDSLSAVSGIIFGVAKGLLRCMVLDPHTNFDYIAVDRAINGFIMAAKHVATTPQAREEVKVFNLNTHKNALFTYQQFWDIMKTLIFKLAFVETLWYVNLTFTQSEKYFWFCVYAFQLLPAYLMDFGLMILGKKRYLVDAQRKIIHSTYLLKFFATRRWKFHTKNFEDLTLTQQGNESEMFNVDTKQIDPREYLVTCVRGVRVQLSKDPLSTTPKAVRMMRVFFVVDCLVKFIFFYWIAKIFMTLTGLSEAVSGLITRP